METQARHLLVGIFTLSVMVAAISFVLWLNKKTDYRHFLTYDVVFNEAVSGLNKGGIVEFNGIRVGEVVSLRLDPEDAQKVIARIRIDPTAPIRTDTEAKLISSGITGLSVIRLSSGRLNNSQTLLADDTHIPVIMATPSPLSKLLSNGEGLLTMLNDISAQLKAFLSPENQKSTEHILQHLDQISTKLSQQDLQIDALIQQAIQASQHADQSFQAAQQLLNTSQQLLTQEGAKTLQQAQSSLAHAEQAFMTLNQTLSQNQDHIEKTLVGMRELGPTLQELRKTLNSIHHISQQLEQNPNQYLFNTGTVKEYQP